MNKFENLRVFWGDSDLNYLTISAKFGQALALHRGLKGKLLLSVALFSGRLHEYPHHISKNRSHLIEKIF